MIVNYISNVTLPQVDPIVIEIKHSSSFSSGIVMFLVGMTINIHSDHILRSLRKPGETGYVIPRGRLLLINCTLNYRLQHSENNIFSTNQHVVQ